MIKTVKVLIVLQLLLVVCGKHCRSPLLPGSDLSSPEKTFRTLEKTAKADDFEKYLECLYFIYILKNEGYTDKQAIMMQESLRVWIVKKPELKEVKEWIEFSMIIFKQCDFKILDKRDVDDNTSELVIHTIPKPNSTKFGENTSKYSFIKYNNKWLFNFKCLPVTNGD